MTDTITSTQPLVSYCSGCGEKIRRDGHGIALPGGRFFCGDCVSPEAEMAITNGVVTIALPGLTGLRIDTTTRVIAVDGISGESDGPTSPDWLVHDLRDGGYGDFHRLRDRDDCGALDCSPAEHVGAYPHVHETIEDVTECTECMGRAAELRILADV